MTDLLDMMSRWPARAVPAGETLIHEGVRADRLYMIASGAFDIVRGGVRVVEIRTPGAFLGEMSAVLGSAPTASVVATENARVHVVDHASSAVRADPELVLAIAQLLAHRLSALTAYLVDIKQQYADSDSHLGLMDQVLASLMLMPIGSVSAGSLRSDVPDY